MRKEVAFGGVTRVPGGAISADGDLLGAVNVVNDGMGIELLEQPEELFELATGETLLCIHEPVGGDKHYVTQIVVEAPTPSVQTRSVVPQVVDGELPIGDDDGYGGGNTGGGSGSGTSTGGGTPPSPQGQTDQDPLNPATDTDTSKGAYAAPSGQDASDVEDAYEAQETAENYSRTYDDGGTDVTAFTNVGVYLCYWVWDASAGTGGDYVRKQIIDITPFGKVTAIQPMGNVLVCNHEGGKKTVYADENDTTGTEITYPAEIRYWLWKPNNTKMESGVLVADPKYLGLGSKPPMLEITFGLKSEFTYYPKTKSVFDSGNSGSYKKYGGISIDSYPYTDTVPLFWGGKKSNSWVPPYDVAITETNPSEIKTHQGDFAQGAPKSEHFQFTYTIDGVESPDGKTDVAGMKINWTQTTLGSYNKFIAEQHKENKFVFPFYCRYGWELFDGSIIMHSTPVLLIPNSRGPIFALDGVYGLKADIDDVGETYEKVRIQFNGRTYGFASTLMRHIKELSDADKERLWNWKDLIRGIAVFVTPPIYNYNQGGQVLGWHCLNSNEPSNNNRDPWASLYTVGDVHYMKPVTNGGTTSYADYPTAAVSDNDPVGGPVSLKWGFQYLDSDIFQPYVDTTPNSDVTYTFPDYCLTIPQKEEKDVLELHENAGQFFRLADITFDQLLTRTETENDNVVTVTWGGAAGAQETDNSVVVRHKPLVIGNKKLLTIANQDFMKDDNHSHDSLSANVLYGYNRRLNMAQVSRMMHNPLPLRVQWGDDSHIDWSNTTDPEYWQMTIYAKNGAKIARLKTTEKTKTVKWPQYIFYPDTNAYEAVISAGENKYKVRLKEHKALNGVFWLGDFYNAVDDLYNYKLTVADNSTLVVGSDANKIVDESSKIYTSETDNPFYVPSGNINIAGGGEVRALCAATQAMSQGQFGQHPMYCFTSEGVWALSVADTGGWATIQPITRDVIGEKTAPLSLDSTVAFITDRGLLQLAGAEVKILSEPLMNIDYTTQNSLDKRSQIMTALDLSYTGRTPFATMNSVINTLQIFPRCRANLMYDPKNGRIYVTEFTDTGQFMPSWVYNIKSGLWTQATTKICRQIVSYPECITQQGNAVIQIGENGEDPSRRYPEGLIITRPIKMGEMGTLKKWREMMVRGHESPYNYAWGKGDIQCALWGSRDFLTHALIGTSQTPRIMRYSGTPYFAHSVMVAIKAESATASSPLFNVWVNGVDVEYTPEDINRMR